MNTMILHKILLSVLVALQVIGPSWVVALHTSEAFAQGPKSQARIAGLRGVVTVTPATDDRLGYAPKYRSSLTTGDVIATEEESIAELLLDSQGLFTIQEYSEAILGKQAAGDLSLYLQVGAVEGSLPMKGGDGTSLTVSTPNIRATTNGGLITAEVQPTLGETVKAIFPDKSFVVRTSLRAQSNPPGKVALLETFCVKEGTLQVEYPGTQAEVREQKEVPLGQCVGFYNGVLRAMGDESHIADWRAICVVGNHCEIPDQAKKLIAKKQMGQALALEQALMGSDPEDPKVDEQIIIATTGISLGASINDSGSEVQVPGGAPILPTTGEDPGDQGLGGSLLPTTGGVTLPPVVGVSPPPSGAAVSLVSGNIQSAAALTLGIKMVGGWGLLSFLKGNFTADKELLLADSGNLAEAPHLGKAPQSSLVVQGLSPNGFGSPSNQKLPLLFRALAHNLPEFKQVKNSNVQLGTADVQLGSDPRSREIQLGQLAQFSRSPMIDPDNILASLPDKSAEFPCHSSGGSCFQVILAAGLGGLETPINPDPGAGVDAAIQVRSSSTPGEMRLVTLKKGVVLGNTQVSLALQEKTNDAFSGLEPTLGQAIQGTAVAILGKPGEPALVNAEDRVLAILDGSGIQSDDPTVTTALLAILDGSLKGPDQPSVIGQDADGNNLVREDVSPIIEMIDGSAEVTTGVMVGSTATSGQTDILDQALLEASAPLLAMMRSSLTTASDFGRVAGKNAKLSATLVSGDALVRLNASSLMVNGNLFSVTGGGQLTVVNGSLLSAQGSSTVTLNGGVFVHVGAGSLFSLTNGALVDFGTGNNVVNVVNNLCLGGGCFAPFADTGLKVAGNPADFSAPTGFKPFVDLGTFSDGSKNVVNVGQDAAILAVDPGGSIQIK